MKDKREECGCHKECTVLEHQCAKPCVWPKCLTDAEKAMEMAEIARDIFGDLCMGPLIRCVICGYECLASAAFELHEIAPDIWKWICLSDVMGAGLEEGK